MDNHCHHHVHGQPFSGVTGLKVFPGGMIFPGLFIIAIFTGSLGAGLGAGLAWLRRRATTCSHVAPHKETS